MAAVNCDNARYWEWFSHCSPVWLIVLIALVLLIVCGLCAYQFVLCLRRKDVAVQKKETP